MPEVEIKPDLDPNQTQVLVTGEGEVHGDFFVDRKSAKEWAIDVLVVYFDFSYSAAKSLVDEAACDCDGSEHSRHCWWVVHHDDDRDQIT